MSSVILFSNVSYFKKIWSFNYHKNVRLSYLLYYNVNAVELIAIPSHLEW